MHHPPNLRKYILNDVLKREYPDNNSMRRRPAVPHRIRYQHFLRLFCRQYILLGDLAGSTCLAEVVRIRRAVVEEAMVLEDPDSNLAVGGHNSH